jgi:hypothetical protein
VADVAACEVHLTVTTCALGCADLVDRSTVMMRSFGEMVESPDDCASGQSASSFVDAHDGEDAPGLERIGRIF